MRVFVAGATGAMGRPLVRRLTASGHAVIGMTRSAGRAALVRADGGIPVVADALEPQAVTRAVLEARPTHLVHLLTALPPAGPLRPSELRATNRLRTEGTAHLLAAARAAGVRRVVAESFAMVYGPVPPGGPPLDEATPMPEVPSGPLREAVAPLRDLELQLRAATREAGTETVALRFGGVIGAGVGSTDALVAQARAGRLFAPRHAPGLFSFVHVDDAAQAIALALDHSHPGPVYNVADDVPLSMAAYLELISRTFGTRPPRLVPGWIVRLAAPLAAEMGRLWLPLSNRRLRGELGWAPRYASPAEALAATAVAEEAAA